MYSIGLQKTHKGKPKKCSSRPKPQIFQNKPLIPQIYSPKLSVLGNPCILCVINTLTHSCATNIDLGSWSQAQLWDLHAGLLRVNRKHNRSAGWKHCVANLLTLFKHKKHLRLRYLLHKDCIRSYSLKDNSLPLVAHDEILDIMQYSSNGQRIKVSYLYGEYLLPFNSIMRHKP